jgi:hypothetical protein
MIKLFRNIRQNLMETGKTGKYLKYAIGEIILVVIGILIALYINDLNQQKADRLQEETILLGIKNEMIENKIELIKVQNDQKKAVESGYAILDFFGKNIDTINAKKIDTLLMHSEFNHTFDANLGMLKSAISSGQINKIKNKDLKKLLLSYEFLTIDLREDYSTINKLKIETLWPITDKYISGRKRWSNTYTKLSNSHFSDDYKGLFNLKEFESVIAYIIAFRHELTAEEKNVLSVTQDILKHLDKINLEKN